jgi:uncharacterized protein YidB (DUF937 family)
MGLLEGIQGSVIGAEALSLVKDYVEKQGGLQNVVNQFDKAGFGDTMKSWISKGPNLPITADQIHQALGSDTVKALAAKMGLPADKIVEMLAQHLPAAIDKATPEEKLPTSAIKDSAYALSPRAKAVLNGIRIVEEDLRSSGGAYDLDEVRDLMHGLSASLIDSYVRDGSLLAVPGPSNNPRFPAVQFNDDGTVVEGLKEVRDALPTKNVFTVLNFLVHPDRRLGDRRPIDLLKVGNVNIVVEAARRLGEQGA